MLGVYIWLSVFMELGHLPPCESVASDDLLVLGIPYHQLEACLVLQVEVVQVALRAASATDGAERHLAQASDLPQHIRSVLVVDYIYFIVSSVGVAEECLLVQLLFKEVNLNGFYDWN